MKVVTVAGTRPELIRLSRVIPALDEVCEHTFVWTGQNYDPRLSDVFFKDLDLRDPDERLGVTPDAPAFVRVGQILAESAKVLEEVKPDKVLILGDTNSALSAFVAKRMGIPVYHMEAGNRCYDDRSPEEVNRRVIDACSDVLLPYTQRSRDNLLAEGYPARRIYVTGNPIHEVLRYYDDKRRKWFPLALHEFDVDVGEYYLVTLHRAENVDDLSRLKWAIDSLCAVQEEFRLPVLVSTHPHTRQRLEGMCLDWSQPTTRVEWRGISWLDPMPFHKFVTLEEHARAVLTDSGTVQEEACLLGVPAITLRDTTERPETVECGSNVVTGLHPDRVVEALHNAEDRHWDLPEGYVEERVSKRVAQILLSEVPR